MPKTISQSNHFQNYDNIAAKIELYNELQKGLDDIAAGRTYSEEEVFAMLDKIFEQNNLK